MSSVEQTCLTCRYNDGSSCTHDDKSCVQGPVREFPLWGAKPVAAPERVKMLHEGAKLTAGDRDKEYGDPAINMACAGELKRVIRSHLTREISAAEQEALDMVLTKISRFVTGTPKRDTFVDGATYFAILGELALKNSS